MNANRKFAIGLTLVTISFIPKYSSIALPRNDYQKPSQYIVEKCQFEDKTHPILGVIAKNGLKAGIINQSTFLELIDYRPPVCRQIWKRDFYKAETDAAAQCCTLVKGKSKSQIESLLGQPAFIGNTQMLNETAHPQELWCYRLGGNNIPLGLTFDGSKCIQAIICDKNQAIKTRLSSCYPIAPAVHPILKVLPGESLNLRKIDITIFRKLKDSFVLGDIANWRKLYGAAEQEAAQKFCKRVSGFTKEQVENLVGQPFYRGGIMPGWSCAKPKQDIWLYTFGRTNVLVRLIFDSGKCVKSEIYGRSDDLIYQRWREHEVATFAIDKTIKQIIEHEGIPIGVEDELQSSNAGDSSMYYASAPFSGITILLSGGKCAKIQLSQISQ